MALPILAALLAIPPLIKGLGVEQFGVLSLGWVVMGYFALFDLGLGLATTKFAAEHIRDADKSRLASVVWTSLHLHAVLGLLGGALFAFLTPWLTDQAFQIPPQMRSEARTAFYWLAASIPFIIIAVCLRGLLEAAGRFGSINRVRIGGSLLNYLAPLAVLHFTHELVPMVAAIAIGRALVLVALTRPCFSVMPLVPVRPIDRTAITALFRFGGWVLVSSLVPPLIMVADRFFVATFFSIAFVAYYVIPYEIVTKLWMFSASLLNALFPMMVALARSDPMQLRVVGERCERYLIVCVAPLVGCILVFSRDFFLLWLGMDFAEQSTTVAQWLAVGLLVHVVAQVPITLVQAAGRPELIAKLQVGQLVPYAVVAWLLLSVFEIAGIAMAWAVRAAVELTLSRIIATKVVGAFPRSGIRPMVQWLTVFTFVAACWAIDSLFGFATSVKVATLVPILAVYVIWQWRMLLTAQERAFVLARLGAVVTDHAKH
jgi:O-antigen/teichoic acid export membrane protein